MRLRLFLVQIFVFITAIVHYDIIKISFKASKHVEKSREVIQRVQAEADAEEETGGGRRSRRSAAVSASMAMSYLTQTEDQVDSVYFGTRKMGPPPRVSIFRLNLIDT